MTFVIRGSQANAGGQEQPLTLGTVRRAVRSARPSRLDTLGVPTANGHMPGRDPTPRYQPPVEQTVEDANHGDLQPRRRPPLREPAHRSLTLQRSKPLTTLRQPQQQQQLHLRTHRYHAVQSSILTPQTRTTDLLLRQAQHDAQDCLDVVVESMRPYKQPAMEPGRRLILDARFVRCILRIRRLCAEPCDVYTFASGTRRHDACRRSYREPALQQLPCSSSPRSLRRAGPAVYGQDRARRLSPRRCDLPPTST